MPAARDDEDTEPLADEPASRIRQWRRAAVALACLFASLPLAARLFLDSWRFDGALPLAGLCLAAAAYLYFAGRDSEPPVPDSATMLDEALRMSELGQTARGLALLDEAIRVNPHLWQAWEYRARMRLVDPRAAETALADFTEAIRLAPEEQHLYIMRSQVYQLLGDDASAQTDQETAARLGWISPQA